jgi:hypothetical protein
MTNDSLTPEELDLIKRFSRAPKCMHDPKKVVDLVNSWKCGDCGFIAVKTIF